MIEVPSVAQLYEEVDAAFRTAYPGAGRPGDAGWRRRWLVQRDRHLRREVDRIYSAAYPDAPHHLDLSNPLHDRYRQLWLDTRRALWSNAPEPETAGSGSV